jgi:hypothetical protein
MDGMEGINNPSVRFYCLSKGTLDLMLRNIEDARKSKDEPFGKALEIYIGYRIKVGCIGCTKGEGNCAHWSPEKIEVNRS